MKLLVRIADIRMRLSNTTNPVGTADEKFTLVTKCRSEESKRMLGRPTIKVFATSTTSTLIENRPESFFLTFPRLGSD